MPTSSDSDEIPEAEQGYCSNCGNDSFHYFTRAGGHILECTDCESREGAVTRAELAEEFGEDV